MNKNKIIIKNLESLEAMESAFELLSQIYPQMDFASYCKNISEMIAMNQFKMVGAFHQENLVGVSGYWVLRMLYCGKYLQVSSFAVDQNSRNLGVGTLILEHLEHVAKNLNCDKIVLDSYTENKKSHSLYFNNGFHIRGFHFMKGV